MFVTIYRILRPEASLHAGAVSSKPVKACLFLLFLLFTNVVYGQAVSGSRPTYVIIIQDRIVPEDTLDAYARNGKVKAITKGVTEAQRAALASLHGEQVGPKEFIILVALYSEQERKEKEKMSDRRMPAVKQPEQDEFLLKAGDQAKDFTLRMLGGGEVRLTALKGKVVLINFWATWCAPCLLEFYDFPAKIITPFQTQDFVLLAVSRGESKERVAGKMQALKKDGIDFNVGLDPEEAIWQQYATGAIPKSFLIDQNGIIRYVSSGYSEENVDKLAHEIRQLLGQ